MTTDPICGMTVDETTAISAEKDGKVWYFCHDSCRRKFLGLPPDTIAVRAHTANYFCPMCEGVESESPATCAKCGMALESSGLSSTGDTAELDNMVRRLKWGLIFGIPLLLLAMGPMLVPSLHTIVPPPRSRWLEFLLATPVVLWCGFPFFQRAWHSIKTLNLNMFTLIGLGTGTAFLYSLIALLVPDLFPLSFQHHGTIPLYFEAASTIIVLVLLGQVMELKARGKTGSAIRELLKLTPTTACVLHDGIEQEVEISKVHPGNIIRVRPGGYARHTAQNLQILPVTDFQSIPGEGVSGLVKGEFIQLEKAVPPAAGNAQITQNPPTHFTHVIIKRNGVVAGQISLSDKIKPTTPAAIQSLHKMDMQIILLTGDNQNAANRVAHELNIDQVHAGLSPVEKQDVIKSLKSQGRIVAMAGDGINDAPALALADIGIAMGTGTDVAMETAGVVLVKGDLQGIARSISLSRTVMRNIRQNLFWAFAYNLIGVPLAAGLLYPWTGVLMNPMIAAFAMSFSSVSVITNALRLNRPN